MEWWRTFPFKDKDIAQARDAIIILEDNLKAGLPALEETKRRIAQNDGLQAPRRQSAFSRMYGGR